ncbi:polysaccharide deacetylase family protein [Bradyrhizobium sp. WSM3983]|uniref:polysaccharide deacetylase family protein n=1 Tax=Bradyrhizobium sp. WSM3983 TaxID=1038867 RepID=UPI00041FBC8A|nr:polysaccharide deacetylase family protein [Bradyrhizobium sp. WSM3983]
MNSEFGSSFRNRLNYASIYNRPALTLPGNARVAVWTIVNLENWSPSGAMPRTILPPPMGQPLLPDLPNWAWYEYGMRVGFWRFLEALGERNLNATLAVNGSACADYREACEAAHRAGWEFMGHGLAQKPMHMVDDQGAEIVATMRAIAGITGHAPRGWESPGLTETDATLDFLAEAGIEYVADWVLDDQPVSLKTRSGAIVSVPYSVEINDVVLSAVQQQPSDEIYRRGRDQFDRLYIEGAKAPRIMAISIHPYLTGVPHRIKYLEMLYDYILGHDSVLMWRGEQILDWYKGQICSDLPPKRPPDRASSPT